MNQVLKTFEGEIKSYLLDNGHSLDMAPYGKVKTQLTFSKQIEEFLEVLKEGSDEFYWLS